MLLTARSVPTDEEGRLGTALACLLNSCHAGLGTALASAQRLRLPSPRQHSTCHPSQDELSRKAGTGNAMQQISCQQARRLRLPSPRLLA